MLMQLAKPPSETNPVLNEQPSYISYMLRLWRVNEAGRSIWRASLEDPHTGKQMGFADLDGLFTFLRRQLDPTDPDQQFQTSGHKGQSI
jgi:hypothetical protein